MEPYRPYKNYLPSKTIWIVVGTIIIVGIGFILVPKIITYFQNRSVAPATDSAGLVIIPSGDPTTRDTDHDGVADWQEIAVGLDPNNPETIPGTPDAQKFETFKTTLGYDLFAQAEAEITDTDKLSLALSNDIAQGSGDSVSISNATAGEIFNYIQARKDKILVLSLKDIVVVEDSLQNNQLYKSNIETILKDDVVTKNFASHLTSYLDGTGSREAVERDLSYIEKTLALLKSTPVPNAATPLHLVMVNSVQGIYQTIQGIEDGVIDELVRLSVLALLQDYAISLSTSAGKLPLYFSVALDKNGYIQ